MLCARIKQYYFNWCIPNSFKTVRNSNRYHNQLPWPDFCSNIADSSFCPALVDVNKMSFFWVHVQWNLVINPNKFNSAGFSCSKSRVFEIFSINLELPEFFGNINYLRLQAALHNLLFDSFVIKRNQKADNNA